MFKRPRLDAAPAPYSQVAFARAVQESVAAPPRRTAVREVGTHAVVEASASKPGRMLIQLIQAGWSLNDHFFPADVLKRDGPAAWPVGTKAFVDHATDAEDEARPSGSIKDLAAVVTTTPYWDEQRQALLAEVRLFEPWRAVLTDMAEHIGMSIRAWAYGDQGEAEGRQGFVVSGIPEGRSVDFVTAPAAGGSIVAVLESVQKRSVAEARNVGAWLESRLHLALTELGDHMYGDGRLTRAERITLSAAIGDALTAWTARVEAEAPQLFQRDLWEEPTEPAPAVDVQSTEAAVAESSRDEPTAQDDRPTTAENEDGPGSPPDTNPQDEEEGSMPEPTEDMKLREAAEAARVKAEQERETALAEAEQARQELAQFRAVEAARPIVVSLLAESGLPAAAQARVTAAVTNTTAVPLTEGHSLDEAAFRTRVGAEIQAESAYVAQLAENTGAGQVRGMGAAPMRESTSFASVVAAQPVNSALVEAFRARGMSESAAKLAAAGRP